MVLFGGNLEIGYVGFLEDYSGISGPLSLIGCKVLVDGQKNTRSERLSSERAVMPSGLGG